MKLKGLALSLPICDWRPFFAPDSRLPFLSSPTSTKPGNFLHSVGRAGQICNWDVSWWPKDTVYYDCFWSIASLWTHLPDGEPVTYVVRRLYLDGKALLRFEIAIYANCWSVSPPTKQSLAECAHQFLTDANFKIGHRYNEKSLSLVRSLEALTRHFAIATACAPEVAQDCRRLNPELQVLAEAEKGELDQTYKRIDPSKPYYLRFKLLDITGLTAPLVTAYIIYPKGFISHPKSSNMVDLRSVRRPIRWLHSNLEVLEHIIGECVRSRIESSAVEEYLETLAEGLWRTPIGALPQPRIMQLLMEILKRHHGHSVERLVESLADTSLSSEAKERISCSLRRISLGDT